MLKTLMKDKNLTKYKLAKISKVPYATVSDICNDKSQLEKCSAETVYKLAKALDVPMETLLEPYIIKHSKFETDFIENN